MLSPVFSNAMNAALAMRRTAREQGLLAEALLENGETELAILMSVHAASSAADADDPFAIGEALLFAVEATGDPLLAEYAAMLFDRARKSDPRSDDGIVYTPGTDKGFAVTGMFSLPAFLACAGFYDDAVKQLNGYRKALFDEKKRLFCEDGIASGRVNALALLGTVRTLELLPGNRKADRDWLIGCVTGLLDKLLPHETEDGLFNFIPEDEETFPELSFSMAAATAIYRGIRAGWLDKTYRDAADRAFNASLANLDSYGLVRSVPGDPDYDKPGTSCEAQCLFLLMGAARDALGK